eukprot:1959709-Alexandrium_andersonii.AAC.1
MALTDWADAARAEWARAGAVAVAVAPPWPAIAVEGPLPGASNADWLAQRRGCRRQRAACP